MMAGIAFVQLDESPESEWQVRVDRIEAFRETGDGVEVLTSSGVILRGSRSVPSFMAAVQHAISTLDDGA